MPFFLRLALALCLWSASFVLGQTPRAQLPEGFTAYLTTHTTNRYGANIMVNAGQMQVGDLPNLFNRYSHGGQSVLPDPNVPIDVIVVVPRGTSEEARQEFAKKIMDVMRSRYSSIKLNIRESFVDLDESDRQIQQSQEVVDELRTKIPAEEEAAQAFVQAAQDTLDTARTENADLRRSWAQRVTGLLAPLNGTHPYNTVIAAQIIALGKFATASSVLISKYGLNVWSLIIGGLNGTISAAFGYKAKDWSDLCTKHRIPFFQDSKIIGWYNRNGWFKSAFVNFFRSFIISFCLRGLAASTGQTVAVPGSESRRPVEGPLNYEFFVGGLPLALMEVWLDGLLDDGARALELKHYMNHQSRSYALWVIGIIDTLMHATFRADLVFAAYGFASVSWVLKAAVWASGKFLPAPPPQFVFISDAISTKPQVKLDVSKGSGFFGFFKWFYKMGKGALFASYYRATGQYSISDHKMVAQDLGLGEAWTLVPDEDNLQKINDPKLREDDFPETLNLADSDRQLVRRMLEIRDQMLATTGKVDIEAMCAQALAEIVHE